ncbi:hypothetical protein DH2020_025070 [Rehmannia glutinosa]|uniref:GRF-type domain-containing protein n=1 Tax=Rehmannia glutinosa TaxID=99300 RepID=A0ABR0W1L2_REHGL
MFPETYPYDHHYRFQNFEYFVVMDFEATCDKDKPPFPQEIIEFPSVIVSSATGQLEACFQTYVRPTCNRILTDFCKDLTGIQQVQTHFLHRWINLKVPFHEVFGMEQCNLKQAVEKAGLAWEGRLHCGLDDAKNTARLLALIMQRGFKLSITNSLNAVTWRPQKPLFVPSQHPQRHYGLPSSRVPCCYCGVKSGIEMITKPGPMHGSMFFRCGNWTAATGSRCEYFDWASS